MPSENEHRAGPQSVRKRLLSSQMRTDVMGYLFCLPWIASLLIFTAYPTIASFYYAFTKYSILKPPQWIGFRNYVTLFTKDPLFYKSISNSLYYTVLLVPLGLTTSLALAVLLNQTLAGVGLFRTLYYVPSLVPPVASTLIWMLILNPRLGLLNTALSALGMSRPPGWLTSPVWSKPGLVLMALWGGGSSTLIFLAGLKEVPRELLEAAEIDGANAMRRFWGVTIPMISPVILFNLVMSIIGSFQVFTSAFVAGGGGGGLSGGGPSGAAGGPLDSMLMYMLYLYREAFTYFDMGYASAMAVLLFLAILILTFGIFRTSGRWVYYAGRQ
jgi:multiple sugar transport system permease protein